MGKHVVRVCLAAALLVLICGCGDPLKALSQAVKEAGTAKSANVSLLDEARKAKSLKGLTPEEVEQRTALWKSVDDLLLRSAYAAADLTGQKAWAEFGENASTNAVSETIDELERQGWRVPGNDWRPFVKWAGWLQGVVKAAGQVGTSVLNGTTDVELFARPQVSRATIAYARFCYSPPKDLR